jgi:hypothetical protein
MEKYFFQQIIQSFVDKVLLEEIVSLSPGEWTYNQFAFGNPEKKYYQYLFSQKIWNLGNGTHWMFRHID